MNQRIDYFSLRLQIHSLIQDDRIISTEKRECLVCSTRASFVLRAYIVHTSCMRHLHAQLYGRHEISLAGSGGFVSQKRIKMYRKPSATETG
jgi:hypothetical protein